MRQIKPDNESRHIRNAKTSTIHQSTLCKLTANNKANAGTKENKEEDKHHQLKRTANNELKKNLQTFPKKTLAEFPSTVPAKIRRKSFGTNRTKKTLPDLK